MELLWTEPGHAFGFVGPTLVQVWETTGPNVERMTRIGAALRQRAARGAPVYMLAVVGETSPMPDGPTREVAARFAEHFTCYVGVHEGTSFRMAVVRSVLVSMTLLTRLRTRYEVFSTVEDGVRHLAAQAGGAIDAAELSRGVEALRAKTHG